VTQASARSASVALVVSARRSGNAHAASPAISMMASAPIRSTGIRQYAQPRREAQRVAHAHGDAERRAGLEQCGAIHARLFFRLRSPPAQAAPGAGSCGGPRSRATRARSPPPWPPRPSR